ncbi:hypothetical protein BGW80DRAFT_1356695 [Lactifluus volemus]|nr:hypothetical protein BGW80DRAFT_1356695 [Lactifluus volemus]
MSQLSACWLLSFTYVDRRCRCFSTLTLYRGKGVKPGNQAGNEGPGRCWLTGGGRCVHRGSLLLNFSDDDEDADIDGTEVEGGGAIHQRKEGTGIGTS